MSHRKSITAAFITAIAAAGAIAPSADAATQKFFTTNGEQTFVVPKGVTSVHVTAVGGPGGRGSFGAAPGTNGGNPAHAEADVPVTPGQTLFVEVGGRGENASSGRGGIGGFNGGASGGLSGGAVARFGGAGGGGGGASDVRGVSRVDPESSLRSRIVVAAGGGGGGGGRSGGLGGTAGQFAGSGTSGAVAGGGLGGSGAAPTGPGPGLSGTMGAGGTGQNSAVAVDAGAGGGGGGGLFGGSGGVTGSGGGSNGGGGGAGSSGFGASALRTSILQTIEEPQVTISFTDPPADPAVPVPAPEQPAVTPVLDDLHAAPSTFRAAPSGGTFVTSTKKGTGTKLSWTTSSASMTTFEILAPRTGRKADGACVAPKAGKAVAKKLRCTRWVALGSVVHEDNEGENTIRFSGRVKGKKLARGSYRLQATPSLDDTDGDAVRIPFAIK